MKLIKKAIIIVGISILLLTSLSVSAEDITDATGDVYHYKLTETQWGWQVSTTTRPNIDITKISHTVNDDTLTVTLEVNGVIEDSLKIVYGLTYNTSDATYLFTYFNGSGVGLGMGLDGGFNLSHGTMNASGNTITGSIDLIGESTASEMWAVANEYSVDFTQITGQTEIETWGDWVPDDYFPGTIAGDDDDDTGDDDDDTAGDDDDDDDGGGTGGTPGFEIIAMLGALAIALILLRRKK